MSQETLGTISVGGELTHDLGTTAEVVGIDGVLLTVETADGVELPPLREDDVLSGDWNRT